MTPLDTRRPEEPPPCLLDEITEGFLLLLVSICNLIALIFTHAAHTLTRRHNEKDHL